MLQTGMGEIRDKLFRLDEAVIAALEDDAARCKRSANKQLEAILTAYYALGDVELRDVQGIRAAVDKTSGEGLPVAVRMVGSANDIDKQQGSPKRKKKG